MAIVNTSAREITGKIVYYGPGHSGKTTNLHVIHDSIAMAERRRMFSLKTAGDRTLFFDLLPLDVGRIKGQALRFQLYTVPGQVYYNDSRMKVLQGVDGIVFVADSSSDRLEANEESMQNLYDNLAALDVDPRSVPMVIQYNKRDLPDCIPTTVLDDILNPEAHPAFEAVASKGTGVLETLGEILRLTERSLRSGLVG